MMSKMIKMNTIDEKPGRDNLDREISRRVQSLEADVPPELEHAFLEALQGMRPDAVNPARPVPRRSIWFRGLLATAATLLLATAMVFFYLSLRQNSQSPAFTAEAEEVWLQETTVEGTPATTYVVNPKDPDMTIVWVEKIKQEKK